MTTEITNDKGRKFLVRIVNLGDRYGLDDCLTHDDADPLIEFYDLSYTKGFGPRGQFVSRYCAHTLAGHGGRGLNLDGGEPVWQIDAAALAPVIKTAQEIAVCKPNSWDRCPKCK